MEHGESTLSGDYKKGNIAYTKMMKVMDRIKLSEINIRQQFFELMYHENDSVKLWTAATLLNTFEKEALSVLRKIKENNKSILAFNAQITIEEWGKGTFSERFNWNKLD